MANPMSLAYYSSVLGSADVYEMTFAFVTSASRVSTPSPPSNAFLNTTPGLTSQATIDDFLGTTNEFLLAQFDGVSMGTDTFGLIVDMKGQCKSVHGAHLMVAPIAGQTVLHSLQSPVATLSSSTISNQVAVGANGNIGLKCLATGYNGINDGVIFVKILWQPK